MAYLAIDQEVAGTFSPPVPHQIREPRQAAVGFSTIEWSVVEVARDDRLSSLRPPGALAGLFALIFGEGVNPQLADPKLEALRRMAVLTWHRGYAVPEVEIWDFIRAGYSVGHYDLLAKKISLTRNQKFNRSGRS